MGQADRITISCRRAGVSRLPGGVPGVGLALFVPAHGLEQRRQGDRFQRRHGDLVDLAQHAGERPADFGIVRRARSPPAPSDDVAEQIDDVIERGALSVSREMIAALKL